MMTWFNKSQVEATPADMDRLAQVEHELKIAEREFDESFEAIARHDAARPRLVAIQDRAATKRNLLLRERAELRAKRS